MYLLLYLGEFLKQKEIKMLEEKINELGNRYITNGIYEGYRYVKVNIPEDWDVVNFHSMGISAERDINNPTIVVFGSDSTGVSFSSIIDVIFEFIKPHLAIVEKNKFNADKLIPTHIGKHIIHPNNSPNFECILFVNDLHQVKSPPGPSEYMIIFENP